MEAIIVFFRDTLSGTLYTVVSIVCFILICICIWQLFRRNRKVKEAEEKFASSHVVVINAKGEEETFEVSSSVPITTGMSILPDIVSSATTSPHNIPVTSAVPQIAVGGGLPKSNKPVVMINPLEVANVSSTMNVIGATSAQKSTLGSSVNDYVVSSPYDSSSAQANTAGTVVSSQVVSALVGESKNIFPPSDDNAATSQQNNQNFTN